jgi:prevent-host-death family protein
MELRSNVFTVTNTGKVAGADVPQVYLTDAAGERRMRLLGHVLDGQSRRSYDEDEMSTRKTSTMKPMSARELKNATGEVVRTLRRGESILLTFRGKPLGAIVPLQKGDPEVKPVRPYEVAWAEIEKELGRSKPHFASWKEAENESRGRR